jgi:hypothetical protein
MAGWLEKNQMLGDALTGFKAECRAVKDELAQFKEAAAKAHPQRTRQQTA